MDVSQTVTYRPNVVHRIDGTTKLRWPPGSGAYRLEDRDLAYGSLLGSPTLKAKVKATGAIDGIFPVAAGESLVKTFVLKHWDEGSGMKLDPTSGHYFLYPEHQEHKYMLSNGVYVSELVFVSCAQNSAAYYVVEFVNDSEEPARISTLAFCELSKDVSDEVVVEYDDRLRALIAHSAKNPKLARVVGASREPAGYEASIDRAMAVTPRLPPRMSGKLPSRGDLVGILRYSTSLDRGERASIEFALCVSADGVDEAKSTFASLPSPSKALVETQRRYGNVLGRCVAITPNPQINRGVLWAKANMERVTSEAPQGSGFTNDPMESSNCVGRDAAWFCVGMDCFQPEFAGRCLLGFLRRQRPDGLIVEYFNMVDGSTEDFGLNINDDTPLIVWSAWHHYQTTHDRGFLDEAYPALVKACRHILGQRNGAGLVWCTSEKTGAAGIVGWRNVIKNYRLSGAVTEVNAECYAALRATAAAAVVKGDDATAQEFGAAADALKAAINRHLINPRNGLYYLNIDVDGAPRTDITADLIFPVIFDVAQPDVACAVLQRLSDSDFWTVGGMRTIPHDAVNYSPDGSSGCLGGVWNGVTFWFAKAAAAYLPNFAAEALTMGFENYARNPQRNNTVPGEFSEWLHGQTLVNGGMELSPWFPPRYIWAVVEGLLGFEVAEDRPRITPHLPSRWSWSGLRNFSYRERSLTWFAARVPDLHLWSTEDVDSACPLRVLPTDLGKTALCSGDDALATGLRDESNVVVLVGNTSDRAITTALRIRDLQGAFTGRRFESLGRRWTTLDPVSAQDLDAGLTLLLEPKGFCLFELSKC